MSALWTDWSGFPATGRRNDRRARLRPVPAAPPRLARRPFAVVLIVLFGLGMTGLLMLNTTLQSQAFESRRLDSRATELAHVQADLESQLDQLGAPQELARRASELGMRANPRPAFLVLPKGKVVGRQVRVTGKELPNLVVRTESQMAADEAAAKVRKATRAASQAAARRAEALAAERAAIAAEQAREQAAKTPAEPAAGADPATGSPKVTKSGDR